MSPPLPPSPWLVRRARPEARARLFCFPFAGGGAAAFRGWADALPELEVVAVQAPGRESRLREAPFVRMAPLVEAAVEALELHLDRPFAFFGHSLGGFVAFEVARALRRKGAPLPCHLVVSASPAPTTRPARVPIHGFDDARLLEEVKKYGGTPDEILASRELMAVLLPIIRADFAVYETYETTREAPLPFPILALGGSEDAKVPAASLTAWREQTEAPREPRQLSGGHFFLQTARAELLSIVREALGL